MLYMGDNNSARGSSSHLSLNPPHLSQPVPVTPITNGNDHLQREDNEDNESEVSCQQHKAALGLGDQFIEHHPHNHYQEPATDKNLMAMGDSEDNDDDEGNFSLENFRRQANKFK